jgi:hypothetical protein
MNIRVILGILPAVLWSAFPAIAQAGSTRVFSPKEGSADYQSVMAMHKDADRADKPRDHSYSLIKIYTPKQGSEARTKILNAGANWDTPDPHYRPYMKVIAIRAATMMDPQIWETGDWELAFLKYQYDQYQGKPTGIGYSLVTRNEAGIWTKRWSLDDGGSTVACSAMFDHLNDARKMIAQRGLDPAKFAPELAALEKEVIQEMRKYQGVCVGDF